MPPEAIPARASCYLIGEHGATYAELRRLRQNIANAQEALCGECRAPTTDEQSGCHAGT